MDPHAPTASGLGRALLRLAHAGSNGTLEVTHTRRGRVVDRARFVLHGGTVASVDLPGVAPLHELLELDLERHRRLLDRIEASPGPIGERLVRVGLLSPEALALALRKQMRVRTEAVFRWNAAEFRFVPVAAPGVRAPHPARAIDLVMHACRSTMRAMPAAVRRRLANADFELSERGRAVLGAAGLQPGELAMRDALLRAGSLRGESLFGIAGPRAERTLHVWSVLGVVRERSMDSTRHRVLLRKRRQLRDGRQAQDPHTLLELDGTTAMTPRQSLKRILKDVHPDRFGPELQGASGEVVRALLEAERALRGK